MPWTMILQLNTKEIGGKIKTLVKNDGIDLGIEERAQKISYLTQKAVELTFNTNPMKKTYQTKLQMS